MTCLRSTVLVRSRTASSSVPTHRFLARRENALAGAHDEVERFGGEGVVCESNLVEFSEDEVSEVVGGEVFDQDRVGHATLDVVVDAE